MTDAPTTTEATTTSPLPTTEDYTQLHDDDSNNNTKQSVSPKSPAPSSPKSLRKSLSYSSRNRKLIVFASTSKYQWLLALIVVAPLIAILMSIILFDVHSQDEYKNSSTIWALCWCFIFILVLYMAVLPRQVDVRSNGTVAIKTCLLTFFIDDIARAYRGFNIEPTYDFIMRRRIMLNTTLDRDGAVVIRRHHGKWDVVVTPEDPEGFVLAIEKMVRKKEDESENSFVAVGKTKPNLASTSSTPPVTV